MAFRMDVNVRGTGNVAARVATIAYVARAAATQALQEECEVELKEARRRTPVDTGRLKESGHVVGPTVIGGNKLVANIVFETEYAVYVHENLEAFHRVGQAKFLESVLLESADGFPERVRARMADLMGTR